MEIIENDSRRDSFERLHYRASMILTRITRITGFRKKQYCQLGRFIFVQIGSSVPLFYIETFALFNFLINDGRLILLFQKSGSKKAIRREKQEIIILANELIIAEFFTMIF